jgi:hypothetical protein
MGPSGSQANRFDGKNISFVSFEFLPSRRLSDRQKSEKQLVELFAAPFGVER